MHFECLGVVCILLHVHLYTSTVDSPYYLIYPQYLYESGGYNFVGYTHRAVHVLI